MCTERKPELVDGILRYAAALGHQTGSLCLAKHSEDISILSPAAAAAAAAAAASGPSAYEC